MIRIDENHRVIFKEGYYIPQYKPYLLRYVPLKWVFGSIWSKYSSKETLRDSSGQTHDINTHVSFKFEEDSIEWINNNKI